MNIHGHVMPAMQQEAAGQIDAALGGLDVKPSGTRPSQCESVAVSVAVNEIKKASAGRPSGCPAWSPLVRPEGFEPSTFGLEVRRSIH
jgi:hypothetical protein